MQITASWGGADVEVEVGEECRSLAALKRALRSALPEEVDLEKVCLEVGGRAMEEEDVVGLVEGSVVAVSPTLAARAAATLREEGRDVDAGGFCQAVEAGDVRLCELYLDAGVVCPPDFLTPLHVACLRDNVALCRLLLERGCDVNARERGGKTPLHYAIWKDKRRLCRLLLAHGCDVNAKCGSGLSPLHVSVSRRNTELCTLLLDHGCDPEAKNNLSQTPLHSAVQKEDEAVCTLLLDHGCDVEARDGREKTPLHYAVRGESTAMCALLLAHGCDVEAEDNAGITPLMACTRGAVRSLLLGDHPSVEQCSETE